MASAEKNFCASLLRTEEQKQCRLPFCAVSALLAEHMAPKIIVETLIAGDRTGSSISAYRFSHV